MDEEEKNLFALYRTINLRGSVDADDEGDGVRFEKRGGCWCQEIFTGQRAHKPSCVACNVLLVVNVMRLCDVVGGEARNMFAAT